MIEFLDIAGFILGWTILGSFWLVLTAVFDYEENFTTARIIFCGPFAWLIMLYVYLRYCRKE